MASCASPITHPDSATLWGLAEGFGARRVAPVISGVGQRPEKAGYGLLPCMVCYLAIGLGRTLPQILATSEARKGSSGCWQGSGTRRRRRRAGFLGQGSDGLLGLSFGGFPATSCRSNTSGALVAATARGKIQSGAGPYRVWDRVYRPCTWVGVFVVHHPSTSEATRLQMQG
jgi:hypothetical protein